MRILTGSEAKTIALLIDPANTDKKVVCPLCHKEDLHVEKITQAGSSRFSLIVSCPNCQMLTHFH